MPLSISSSEINTEQQNKSISVSPFIAKRSFWGPFIAALILLSLYQVIIWMGAIKPSAGLSEMGHNRVSIENYIYDNKQHDIVLTGSSYTQTLESKYFRADAYNLGFGGHSASTGVEIITLMPKKPRVLFIEISDTIALRTDYQLIDYMLSPTNYNIRKKFSMFRDSYQPMNIIIENLKQFKLSRTNNKYYEQIANKRYKDASIKRRQKDNAKPLPPVYVGYIYNESSILQREIDLLNRESVRVILYKLPRDKEIENTFQIKQIDTILHQCFPTSKYEWLPEVKGEWETKDGSHLTPKSAAQYVQFIENYLRQTPVKMSSTD